MAFEPEVASAVIDARAGVSTVTEVEDHFEMQSVVTVSLHARGRHSDDDSPTRARPTMDPANGATTPREPTG